MPPIVKHRSAARDLYHNCNSAEHKRTLLSTHDGIVLGKPTIAKYQQHLLLYLCGLIHYNTSVLLQPTEILYLTISHLNTYNKI